jgi:adenylylsulfate kinase
MERSRTMGERNGCVIWFTGLPASGKTTLANALATRLELLSAPYECLDGDAVRNALGNFGFSEEARNLHVRSVGFTAQALERHGVIAVVSLVSPFKASRDAVRSMCRSFFEVYLSTPLSVCEERDPKGLYKRARSGELADMTGVSSRYEPPVNPELVLNTAVSGVEDCIARIEALLRERGMVTGEACV